LVRIVRTPWCGLGRSLVSVAALAGLLAAGPALAQSGERPAPAAPEKPAADRPAPTPAKERPASAAPAASPATAAQATPAQPAPPQPAPAQAAPAQAAPAQAAPTQPAAPAQPAAQAQPAPSQASPSQASPSQAAPSQAAPAQAAPAQAAPERAAPAAEAPAEPERKPTVARRPVERLTDETPHGPDKEAKAPECAWVGKRVLSLLARDDVDAARQFYQFYTGFHCPTAHIGNSFGCIVADSLVPEMKYLSLRIDTCWADPSAELPPMAESDVERQKQNAGQPPAAKPAEPAAGQPGAGQKK